MMPTRKIALVMALAAQGTEALMITAESPRMLVYVTPLNSSAPKAVEVPSDATVARLIEKAGFKPTTHRILFAGRHLAEGELLADAGVCAEAHVHLVLNDAAAAPRRNRTRGPVTWQDFETPGEKACVVAYGAWLFLVLPWLAGLGVCAFLTAFSRVCLNLCQSEPYSRLPEAHCWCNPLCLYCFCICGCDVGSVGSGRIYCCTCWPQRGCCYHKDLCGNHNRDW